MNQTPAKFFKKNGYCIINLFNNEIIENIKQEVNDKLNSFCKELNNNLKLKNLKNYHKLKITENDHKYFVKNSSRYIKPSAAVVSSSYIIAFISAPTTDILEIKTLAA